MIIPDVNLLLYAHMAAFPEHEGARHWFEMLMNGAEDVGIGAPALFGFIRLSTNPRIFDPPLSADHAATWVEQWLSRPHVHFLLPGPRHLEIAFRLLRALGTGGNLTTDVQLAALAIEHQGTLHSNDTDFGRFAQLRWSNPLKA
jgi:toxin-antitoxin system PIN domain toxin